MSTEAFTPVKVRLSIGTYFYLVMSALFVVFAFFRYGHTFWWVYLVGAVLGLTVIPIFFFLYGVKQEYYVHHEIHSLDDSFFGESTDGSLALSEDPESDDIRTHVAYTQFMGSLTFWQWLKLAFTEGIGHTTLTVKDSILPVLRQTAVFSIITGMVVANIALVGWILLDFYVFNGGA